MQAPVSKPVPPSAHGDPHTSRPGVDVLWDFKPLPPLSLPECPGASEGKRRAESGCGACTFPSRPPQGPRSDRGARASAEAALRLRVDPKPWVQLCLPPRSRFLRLLSSFPADAERPAHGPAPSAALRVSLLLGLPVPTVPAAPAASCYGVPRPSSTPPARPPARLRVRFAVPFTPISSPRSLSFHFHRSFPLDRKHSEVNAVSHPPCVSGGLGYTVGAPWSLLVCTGESCGERLTRWRQRSPDADTSVPSHTLMDQRAGGRASAARPAHPRVAVRLWTLAHGLLQAP